MTTEIISQVIQGISTVGFPIVACYYLYKMITDTLTRYGEKLDKNTEALNRIADKLDMVKEVQEG